MKTKVRHLLKYLSIVYLFKTEREIYEGRIIMDYQVNSTNTISKLDAILSCDEIFYQDFDKSRELLLEFMNEAVRWHVENNSYYAEYCRKNSFNIDDLVTDCWEIPALPSAIFKRHKKYTVSRDDGSLLLTTSSGTQGTISQVPRDNDTLMRFFSSVTAGVQDVLGIEQSELHIYSLSPANDEVEHLWISYVLAGILVYYPTQYYVSGGEFHIQSLINDLRKVNSTYENEQILIVGPPALVLDVTKELEKTELLRLGENCKILTIGGWKSRQGESVKRELFDGRVAKAFGLKNSEAVRDVYNMVELNTVIFECKEHKKHCPPWLFVRAFNPKTLKVQPTGVTGILGYFDPTPLSYPGFILSDDFGKVSERVSCTCGITSDVVEIERRINKSESRGCALKI